MLTRGKNLDLTSVNCFFKKKSKKKLKIKKPRADT